MSIGMDRRTNCVGNFGTSMIGFALVLGFLVFLTLSSVLDLTDVQTAVFPKLKLAFVLSKLTLTLSIVVFFFVMLSRIEKIERDRLTSEHDQLVKCTEMLRHKDVSIRVIACHMLRCIGSQAPEHDKTALDCMYILVNFLQHHQPTISGFNLNKAAESRIQFLIKQADHGPYPQSVDAAVCALAALHEKWHQHKRFNKYLKECGIEMEDVLDGTPFRKKDGKRITKIP